MGQKKAPPLSAFGGPTHMNAVQFRTATQHIVNVAATASPEAAEAGALWYPKVNQAASKASRRLGSLDQAAGVIAATSPNMDFEAVNIHALSEVHRIKASQWREVEKSALMGGRRTPGAQEALAGFTIRQNTDNNLLKAKRIIDGEHLDDVLDPVTSPKTNAFAHNIIDPEGEDFEGLTIDGRAHDIARNQMIPWGTTRAIGGSRPGRARYDDFVATYHAARPAVEERLGRAYPGPATQAVAWVAGKDIERSMTRRVDPKTGRVTGGRQGPSRTGQGYY